MTGWRSILFLLVLILLGLASCFTVSDREYAIVTQFGRITRVIENPGPNFKWPLFLNQVHRIEKRRQVLNTQPIQLLLGDKNPVILSCYVLWKIQDPRMYFLRLQTASSASSKLEAMVTSQLGSILSEYKLNDLLSVRDDQSLTSPLRTLEMKVREACSANTAKEYGIVVEDLGIVRIAYPGVVTEAVYARMSAERQKEAAKYRAEGQEEALKLKAKTDREVAELLAKASEESEGIKAEGDREAMKIYGEAYGKNPELFRLIKSLELYRESLKTNALLVFSADQGLFAPMGQSMRKMSVLSALGEP